MKTLIYTNLTEEIEKYNLGDRSFYNMLGFDILIDKEYNPILIEVNKHPSMLIYNNLEKLDKTNIFIDTLNLVGIIPYSRKSNEPLLKTIKFKNEIEDNINNALCELKRPRGNYELIFPLKKNINIYRKYFIYNYEENIKFWDKILFHY